MEGLDFFPPGLSVNILISVDKKVLVFRKPQGLNSGYWEWEEKGDRRFDFGGDKNPHLKRIWSC